MISQPKVSVIIATSNSADHIEECLGSVYDQTLKEVEIIVVDVNSTDGTKEILEEERISDDRVVFMADGLGSLGHARNIGLDHARAPYVIFVDPDDRLDSEMLEQLCFSLDENPENDLLTCESDSFGDDSVGRTNRDMKRELREANEKDSRRFDMESRLLRRLMFDYATMYRRSYLQEKDIRYYEEPGYGKQDAAFRFLTHVSGNSSLIAAIYYYRRMEIIREPVSDSRAVRDVCAEFRYLKKKLMEDTDTWQKMRYVYWQAYYTENLSLYEKLSGDLRPVLSKRMQGDLIEAINRKEFSREHFDIRVRDEMELLLKSPKAFDADWSGKDRARKSKRDSGIDLRQKISDRIAAQEKMDVELLDGKDKSKRKTERLNRQWLTDEMARDLAPLRMLLGLKTDEMGAILGISESAYKGLEAGKKEISWDQYMALLFLFHYNDRTAPVIDTLGLYPEPLKLRLRKGIVYG